MEVIFFPCVPQTGLFIFLILSSCIVVGNLLQLVCSPACAIPAQSKGGCRTLWTHPCPCSRSVEVTESLSSAPSIFGHLYTHQSALFSLMSTLPPFPDPSLDHCHVFPHSPCCRSVSVCLSVCLSPSVSLPLCLCLSLSPLSLYLLCQT